MRGIPGGSQNLCTGSLVLSKVCRAPNGGLASLNFAAAQGVMGACSGCWAKGSAESQLFSRTASGPLKSGSHRPDMSGIPPDINPGFLSFALAEAGPDCAGKTEENASAANNAPIKIAMRIRIFEFLHRSGSCAYFAAQLLWPTQSARPGRACPFTTTFKINVMVLLSPTGAPFREGCVSMAISSPAFMAFLVHPARTI